MKSQLGKGYTLQLSFNEQGMATNSPELLLKRIQEIVPDATCSSSSTCGSTYCLHSKNSGVVKQVLEVLKTETKKLGIASYKIHGTSIEDIFLDLMSIEAGHESTEPGERNGSRGSDAPTATVQLDDPALQLTSGRKKSPLAQSLTIFYKRCLIIRRSWLSPVLAILIAVSGTCIPLFFMNNRAETCTTTFVPALNVPLYLGNSPYSSIGDSLVPGSQAIISPPNLVSLLGASILHVPVVSVPDNDTFMSTIQQNFLNLSLGGVSMDLNTRNTLLAWEATPPGLTGPTLLNLASNILYNQALNASGRGGNHPSIIAANYQSFPAINSGTLVALKWVAFFGATMVSLIIIVATRLSTGLPCTRVFFPPFLPYTWHWRGGRPFRRCNCLMG